MSVLSNSDPTAVHRAHLKFNLNDVEVRQQPSISSRLLLARSVCDRVVEFFLHARHTPLPRELVEVSIILDEI